ncbi:MAG: aminoacyl-tRNA hydrolase [Patescibacteria group bacterium]
MKVIVGLGNPGDKYLKTRHNAGEFYLSKLRNVWSEKDFTEGKNALWLETRVGKSRPEGGTPTSLSKNKKNASGEKVFLIFPAEMMNNSGTSLKKIMTQLKIKPKPADILVIHDDLDIELGRIKISFARSSGGHNGVESVIKNLKTNKFWRLRIGIGLPRAKSRGKKLIDFILKKFSPNEERILNKNFKRVLEGLETWLVNPARAMSELNRN